MLIDLLKQPVRTEKYSVRANNVDPNIYIFDLDIRLTKTQIKKLIEQLFDVTVISVNTYIAPLKKKRLGFKQGYKTRYKRAIIRLLSGQKLQLFNSDEELKPILTDSAPLESPPLDSSSLDSNSVN